MLRRTSTLAATFIAIAAGLALTACSKPAEEPKEAAAVPAPAPAAEPAPAPKVENTKPLMVGDLQAMAVRDGFLEFPNDNKVFGVGHTPEEVAALLTAAGLPTDKLQLSLQPLLVQTVDRVLLFDTGAGTNFGPNAGQLLANLTAAGTDPKSVTDIFISHVHGDHVGGLVDANGALNFPNAKIHIAKAEWKFLEGLGAEKAKNIGVSNYDALVAGMKPKVDAFAPGSELVKGTVKAVDIKGHTPGHSGYLITQGPDSLLYVGDSMHHSIVSVQKADWPMNFDSDQATGAKSRAALIADSAAKGQRIYAVHFPFPGVGKFEKQGEGFIWVAE
jgi:glyoxylase-like metal-dependent hydrolase (beta-lactamase superfamily II)